MMHTPCALFSSPRTNEGVSSLSGASEGGYDGGEREGAEENLGISIWNEAIEIWK
jgi:hypothetical protein